MSCPRCEMHISEGFYCVRCGYVPPQGVATIGEERNTDASFSSSDRNINASFASHASQTAQEFRTTVPSVTACGFSRTDSHLEL
jgi:hypothetical protein